MPSDRVVMSGDIREAAFILRRWQPLGHNLGFNTVCFDSDLEAVLRAAARMKSKCGAEACNAGAGVLANTRIHDAIRPLEQQFVRERL